MQAGAHLHTKRENVICKIKQMLLATASASATPSASTPSSSSSCCSCTKSKKYSQESELQEDAIMLSVKALETSHTRSFWTLRPDLGLIQIHQQCIKIETVWHDEISDVISSHRHVVQRYWVFAL